MRRRTAPTLSSRNRPPDATREWQPKRKRMLKARPPQIPSTSRTPAGSATKPAVALKPIGGWPSARGARPSGRCAKRARRLRTASDLAPRRRRDVHVGGGSFTSVNARLLIAEVLRARSSAANGGFMGLLSAAEQARIKAACRLPIGLIAHISHAACRSRQRRRCSPTASLAGAAQSRIAPIAPPRGRAFHRPQEPAR